MTFVVKVRFDDVLGNVAEIDRCIDGKPNAIDDLMEKIEQGLELIGATASKDKLHDGVPQCYGKSDETRHQGLDAYGRQG